MNPIDRLVQADRQAKKRICVLGDSLMDVWIHGDLQPSQDGVQKFAERRSLMTPGGAAGAARQLFHWNADVRLLSLLQVDADNQFPQGEAWNAVNCDLGYGVRRMPSKARYLDAQDRIVFRHDVERGYGADANLMNSLRQLAMDRLYGGGWDAVLISDYDKGFLTEQMIRDVIGWCNVQDIPVVADAKRKPNVYEGAIIKGNNAYAAVWAGHVPQPAIMTGGQYVPQVWSDESGELSASLQPVQLVNHVGAGDCFAAHLMLALAHCLPLEESAAIAHAAGRVYVQHPHGRPPWPHEIRRDLDPVGGKVIPTESLPSLRKSVPGRIVWTNGLYRLGPHAGHCWSLRWAKAQGDVLCVGINDDASAGRLRKGKAIRPLEERAYALAAMDAVDWVVPFAGDEPVPEIEALKPDLLVKGFEYSGQQIPGQLTVPQVQFAPESPFPRHWTDLEAGIGLPVSPAKA